MSERGYRVVWVVLLGLAVGYFVGIQVSSVIRSDQQAGQAELAAECQQARQAELELLAENVLEGHDVTIIDGHVTIYLDSGEVLADGEFLEGTEACRDWIGDQQ